MSSKIESNKVYEEDSLKYLNRMNSELIDCIILDPPYFNVMKTKETKWDRQWQNLDDYLKWMNKIIEELNRVSKYSCSLFVFGFPYQLSFLIPLFEKNGFTYRQHIVIDKGLRSVAGRTSSKLKIFPIATEYILYFHKEARHILRDYLQNKQKEKQISSKDINKYLGKASNGGGTWSSIAGLRKSDIQYPTKEDWDKLQSLFGKFNIKYDDYVYKFNPIQKLTDVWSDINFYDKKYTKYHPTQKPYDLIKRLIDCSTDKKDSVLDIFMGSHMTALVCKENSRNFYGCEKDYMYMKKNLLSDKCDLE